MIRYRNKFNPTYCRPLKGALSNETQVFTLGEGAELPVEFAVSIGEYKDVTPVPEEGYQLGDIPTYDEEAGTVAMNVVAVAVQTPEEIEVGIRSAAVAEIKQIRGATLDKFTKFRSGVQMVYDTNYTAATMFLAGDTSLLRTGVTPAQHLSMGARIGMTVEQFANYIIAENVRLGPSAWEVEDRYLKDMVTVQYCPIDNVPVIVTAYREWCDTVSGN